MDVGLLIRTARERNGLDQAQLARLAGTSQPHISRIERGAVSPSIATASRLMRVMGERLAIAASPLPQGNRSAAELRREFELTTPEERLGEAMQLSFTMTSIAAVAQRS